METLMSIKDLTKSYGDEKVLEHLTFDIYAGEILVVLGVSGAGKSTLLNILSGLEKDYSGRVEWRDKVFEQCEVPLPIVFQDFDQLLPWYTVEKNILLPYRRKVLAPKDMEIIAFLGLEAHLKKYPHELSGGMKQRVAIGRSLLSDGQIIFMDEPFGSLDNQRRQQLQALIIDINERYGRTIVFITHDIQEAKYLASRIGVIDEAGHFRIIEKETL
ncbi:MAG: ATP-binding cassette domain-containing protein [Clostridia bacterium]|nr:ATP-binding cassette domain-containing protein [Clostridia bacterium]